MPKAKATSTIIQRPPTITLMGHVDHGKTSILDAIRNTNITASESGGITQHTGAYSVEKNGRKLVFIDTPGHEAFTQMRSRGGKAADIVVLVVAADDGVMPQTREAIQHAKAGEATIIVAINKVDVDNADIDKVKRGLAAEEIFLDGYGGDVPFVETSAINNKGIDGLIDMIFLVAELNEMDFSADPNGILEASVIEATHNPKKGPLCSVIIRNGSMKLRDEIAVLSNGKILTAKVKAMTDSYGNPIKEATVGEVVEVMGFSETPMAGDIVTTRENIKLPTDVGNKSENKAINPFDLFKQVETNKLDLVVKSDTQGTLEAILASLNKIEVENSKLNILASGVGEISDNDVLLASTSKRCIVIGFKVKSKKTADNLADQKKIIIRQYETIYSLLEEIEGALEGVIELSESKIRGRGIVIQVFTLPKSGVKVAGTLVELGRIKDTDRIAIKREGFDEPLHITKIKSLHEGIKEVKMSKAGSEVGILFKEPFDDIEVEDTIEVL